MINAVDDLVLTAKLLLSLAYVVGAGLILLAVLAIAAVVLAFIFFGSYGALFLRPKPNAPLDNRNDPKSVR